jgi:hypothetical protein
MCISIYIQGIFTIEPAAHGADRGRFPGTSNWTGAAGGTFIYASQGHTTGIGSIAENTTVTATGETQDATAREPVREAGSYLPNRRRAAVFRMNLVPIEGDHLSGPSLAATRPGPEN